MSETLQYLISAEHQYDDAELVSIILGNPYGETQYYAPPWDTAQFYPDDVVDECASLQLIYIPGGRIDSKGVYYIPGSRMNRTVGSKEIINWAVPIPQIIEQLIEGGYELDPQYWLKTHHRERIMHLYRNL